ncbi:MAG: AAA family ATPase [Gammaproteobacteria bacterium]
MSYRPTYFDRLPAGAVLQKTDGIEPYVFNDDIVIAVDVALATNRPLLVSGNPGSGKSRLADAIAAVQGWNLLSKTVTSRTRLESLTVEVDQLRRLNDAQARREDSELKPDAYYLNPGIFWWAFQPGTASLRGMNAGQAHRYGVALPYPGNQRGDGPRQPAVLLIDEIDKAEPDLPNDLLEPLDRRRFDLPDGFRMDGGESRITGAEGITLLTVITTNGERELPPAFLRRCVTIELPDPDADKLVEIALKHFPDGNRARIEALAVRMSAFRDKARDRRRRPPGTAEFLDAIHACEKLKIEVSDDEESVWKRIENAVLFKDTRA